MKTKVLFRSSLAEKSELDSCLHCFEVVDSRMDCKECVVIPRYSCLPYYAELEKDLHKVGSRLINTHEQFRWVANFHWYERLAKFTFPTWTDETFHEAPEGQYVVKGRTNSRKLAWNTKMFAPTKKQALNIAADLICDGIIGEQGIIYRQYVPLQTIEVGINGLPFSYEFRCFFYKNVLLADGYYWSIAENTDYTLPNDGLWFAQKIANIARNYNNFFVLDIAKTQSDEWILVEINSGEMSGLSCCSANVLYDNLSNEFI